LSGSRDKLGHITSTKDRKKLKRITTDKDRDGGALQSAMRYNRIASFERNFGNMIYSVIIRYDKIITSIIPISNNNFMLVAFDYDAEAFNDIIMQHIIPLITAGHSKCVF
jgi:hypothetical protein